MLPLNKQTVKVNEQKHQLLPKESVKRKTAKELKTDGTELPALPFTVMCSLSVSFLTCKIETMMLSP